MKQTSLDQKRYLKMYDERSYDTRSYDTRSYFFGIIAEILNKLELNIILTLTQSVITKLKL